MLFIDPAKIYILIYQQHGPLEKLVLQARLIVLLYCGIGPDVCSARTIVQNTIAKQTSNLITVEHS